MHTTPLEALLPLQLDGWTVRVFGTNYSDFWLVVFTDRVLVDNVLQPGELSMKGAMHAALNLFWLGGLFADLCSPLAAWGTGIYGMLPRAVREAHPELHHRAFVVGRYDLAPIRFNFYRYLVGPLWEMYRAGNNLHGLHMPSGMSRNENLGTWELAPTVNGVVARRSSDVEEKYDSTVHMMRVALTRAEQYLKERRFVLLSASLSAGMNCSNVPGAQGMLVGDVLSPETMYVTNAAYLAGQDFTLPDVGAGILNDDVRRGKRITDFDDEHRRVVTVHRNHLLKGLTGMSLGEWFGHLEADSPEIIVPTS